MTSTPARMTVQIILIIYVVITKAGRLVQLPAIIEYYI